MILWCFNISTKKHTAFQLTYINRSRSQYSHCALHSVQCTNFIKLKQNVQNTLTKESQSSTHVLKHEWNYTPLMTRSDMILSELQSDKIISRSCQIVKKIKRQISNVILCRDQLNLAKVRARGMLTHLKYINHEITAVPRLKHFTSSAQCPPPLSLLQLFQTWFN